MTFILFFGTCEFGVHAYVECLQYMYEKEFCKILFLFRGLFFVVVVVPFRQTNRASKSLNKEIIQLFHSFFEKLAGLLLFVLLNSSLSFLPFSIQIRSSADFKWIFFYKIHFFSWQIFCICFCERKQGKISDDDKFDRVGS